MSQDLQTISAEPITGVSGETLRFTVDFTLFGLDPSELLTGTPTVVDTSGLLTITNVQVNTAVFYNKRKKPVYAGKGVIFLCQIPSTVVDGTDIDLYVSCG